jgi:hypothetical protein
MLSFYFSYEHNSLRTSVNNYIIHMRIVLFTSEVWHYVLLDTMKRVQE